VNATLTTLCTIQGKLGTGAACANANDRVVVWIANS
jgi:hypothetical protein